MTHTSTEQQSDALRLARWLGHRSMSGVQPNDLAASTELRRLYARVQELEEEVAHESQWRDLALQFDGHRMRALGHLKKILDAGCSDDSLTQAQDFLHAPPLSGEKVLAERIAAELEASQAQRVPLSSEQVKAGCISESCDFSAHIETGFFAGVRYAEQAHGITQENQQ